MVDKRPALTANPLPLGPGVINPNATPHQARPRFAQDANSFQTVTLALDTAASLQKLSMTGTALWAIDASDLDANITLFFNDQHGEGLPVKKGMFLAGLRFDQVFATWSAQAGKTITLFYGVDTEGLLRVRNALSSFNQIKIDQPDTLTTTADDSVAATTTENILAADTTRRKVILSNPSTNSREFRIGDSNTGAARGIILEPGQTIQIDGTAAVYAYNPHSAAQSISIMEVLD